MKTCADILSDGFSLNKQHIKCSVCSMRSLIFRGNGDAANGNRESSHDPKVVELKQH